MDPYPRAQRAFTPRSATPANTSRDSSSAARRRLLFEVRLEPLPRIG